MNHSGVLIQQEDLIIRKMTDTDEDYQIMTKWLTNPDLLELYEGRDKVFDLEKIKQKYQPRILQEEKVTPCFVYLENKPIGYMQFYELSEETRKEYGLEEDLKAFGIDMFIGDMNMWGKGLGTKMLMLLVDYLFETLKVNIITIDPRVENERAIRSYEKVGFKKIKLLEKRDLHEGKYHDVWFMSIQK